MGLQVSSVLLLLCSLGLVLVQTQQTAGPAGGSDPPIQFTSTAGDTCDMWLSSQDNATMLQVTCRSEGRPYPCEYNCSFRNYPLIYIDEVMRGFMDLQPTCQAPSFIKPEMCRRAPDAQMFQTASLYSQQIPESTRTRVVQGRPVESAGTTSVRKETGQRSSGPLRPGTPAAEQARPPATETPTPTPAAPAAPRKREELARPYWRFLQGVCSYVLGWFHQ